MGVVTFLRRVPPALRWRSERLLVPIARSPLRRAAAAHSVHAQRLVRPGSGRGSVKRPLILRFANAHGSLLPELRWFTEEVVRASDGAVQIAFVNNWTTPDNLREETSTMLGVMKDQADLGWAGTRAFGCLGVRSLDPLQAPLLFDNYESVAAVCSSELTAEMLEPLDDLHLHGLVVLPGPLRKPFAFTRRLLGPRDYEGAKLRIHESLVAEVTYRALGAEAVVLSVRQMAYQPDARVDGLDIQTEALAGWRLAGSITYNVNLWPRTIAIAASRKTYSWLGMSERELLHTAAQRTLDRALEHLRDQEQRDLDALPATVNPIFADLEQIAGIRERVETVYEDLRSHPECRSFLERVEAIARRSG
jgi:TRAP-type C4-dicarboxylate transport system substrate-binding protein